MKSLVILLKQQHFECVCLVTTHWQRNRSVYSIQYTPVPPMVKNEILTDLSLIVKLQKSVSMTYYICSQFVSSLIFHLNLVKNGN